MGTIVPDSRAGQPGAAPPRVQSSIGRSDVDTGMAEQRGHRDGIASDDVPPRILWGTGGAWVMVALGAAHTP